MDGWLKRHRFKLSNSGPLRSGAPGKTHGLEDRKIPMCLSFLFWVDGSTDAVETAYPMLELGKTREFRVTVDHREGFSV
ncbi:hypothetical protein PISMIDRAFT_520421 [Pisolithus microcarpus 441]|uniref:Uncharacterized protein n=1 Tax=Pisolithus microcarpus 441 TaxID=765257 RepID=A0A0D0A484_9AGAM|nr:hypothetical protein PISMIDRAFT_520421 [Pisolithus microcarpus 441]